MSLLPETFVKLSWLRKSFLSFGTWWCKAIVDDAEHFHMPFHLHMPFHFLMSLHLLMSFHLFMSF